MPKVCQLHFEFSLVCYQQNIAKAVNGRLTPVKPANAIEQAVVGRGTCHGVTTFANDDESTLPSDFNLLNDWFNARCSPEESLLRDAVEVSAEGQTVSGVFVERS